MNILAIDPGAGGGIAVMTSHVQVYAMPETRGDVIELFDRLIAGKPENWRAYAEKISGFIPDGGAYQMFQFGAKVERTACIIEVMRVRLIEVTPQRWQGELGLGNSNRMRVASAPRFAAPKGLDRATLATMKKEHAAKVSEWKREHAAEIASTKSFNARAKTDWKNKLKSDAQRRFPGIRVTLGNCDALLLLDYACRQEGLRTVPPPRAPEPTIEEPALPFDTCRPPEPEEPLPLPGI